MRDGIGGGVLHRPPAAQPPDRRCRAALREIVLRCLSETAEDDMTAFEVFAIYVTPFVIIGIAVKLLMKRYAVDLPDVQKQAGAAPKRRFLLGAWRQD
ncbi:hypothetical protein [Bradyrhizobium sp. Ce-3]|uniref:hypothetical protein n=1 Tax=Bradyrhizobium sp. Ce-3 TaxID=2913970 RepID=UPI001FBB46E8|nr:hypothetical protein [Bradyrhizobium sp. Ce-3]